MATTGGLVNKFCLTSTFSVIYKLPDSCYSGLADFFLATFLTVLVVFLAVLAIFGLVVLVFLAVFMSPLRISRASLASSDSLLPPKFAPLMSIFQPVSLAANRTFWPSLPIAKDNWSSGTETCALFFDIIFTSITLAGD